MKLLCVQKAIYRNNRLNDNQRPQPIENEIYNAVGEYYEHGETWYILEEFGPNECFAPEMFIPVSEIDEVKVHNDKFLKEDLW